MSPVGTELSNTHITEVLIGNFDDPLARGAKILFRGLACILFFHLQEVPILKQHITSCRRISPSRVWVRVKTLKGIAKAHVVDLRGTLRKTRRQRQRERH